MSRFYLTIIHLSCLMLFFTPATHSQDLKSLVRSGDMAAENGNYFGAAHFYKQAIHLSENVPELYYKMAEACRKDNDYAQAAKYYNKLVPHFIDKFPMAEYYLAQMLKSCERFLEAQYHFRNYYERHKEKETLELKKAKREIIACEKAQRMLFRPVSADIEHMDTSINSTYAELCADGYADSLTYFTAILPTDTSKKAFNANIYLNSDSGTTILLDSQINQPGMQAANPFWDSVTNELFFTLSKKGEPPHIYKAKKQNNGWAKAIKLPAQINQPDYASTHPVTVHTDSLSYILYASNKPGGMGNFDLYYNVIKTNSTYSRPYNIGRRTPDDSEYAYLIDTTSVFNTPANEITPFYDKSDSTLYFASEWFYGMGGYDMFKMNFDFNMPDTTSISNLGYPINTPRNDLYYRIDKTHKKAYLTSNREGSLTYKHQSCCNDIYAYKLPDISKEPEKTPEEIRQEEIITMTRMAEKIIPLTLYFHNDRPDPGSWDTITNQTYDSCFNNYMDRQQEYKKKFAAGLEGKARMQAIDSIDFFFENQVNKEFQELRKFLLLLEELLAEEQQVILTIKGYTSPLHTPDYNLNLAKRRISSFINYIENYKGGKFMSYIESGLLNIETLPYGETKVRKGISDDPSDRRNSVYNPLAAQERKIKVLAVKISETEKQK
ncbi:MAG: tetratricopeptide repeat protein [Bacteroidota bacterium]